MLKQVNHNLPLTGIKDSYGDTTYHYTSEHKVVRTDLSLKKDIIPYHLTNTSPRRRWVKGLGDTPWLLYHEEQIPITAGNAVVMAEGEKTCDYIQSQLSLVALSPQGSLWNVEYLTEAFHRLRVRDFGLNAVVYLPDCDKPGIVKRNAVVVAAAHAKMACVVIPSELYAPQPDAVPPGFDLADSELTCTDTFISRANQFLSTTNLYQTLLT